MNDMHKFSHKVRVRACGLLEEDDKVLLIKHENVGELGFLWSPPGGGVEFGESAQETLIREFREETGLEIEINNFLFLNEFIDERFHAIELFFSVKRLGGTMKLGNDPELADNEQIMQELKFIAYPDMIQMDKKSLHNAFTHFRHPKEVFNIKGHINFLNI